MLGDCLERLKELPDNSVDSVVTDPPYGLSFMGKKWDYDVPNVDVWKECLRVLKPGGHLLAFAGTRTQHRMAVRIEDAGFEIRDMIAWVYASGFPKSHNLKGEWQGWGTALKPALEPITVARKPLDEKTVAANVLEHGTGAINVDGCRVAATGESLHGGGSTVGKRAENHNEGWQRPWMDDEAAREAMRERSAASQAKAEQLGRWPANLIHDGSDEVVGLFPVTTSGGGAIRKNAKGLFGLGGDGVANVEYGDTGSAARFFYCAKASKKDREGSTHPTMKPTALMRYLCRLVTPPEGIVLDPFMGSGSTGKAAALEGFQFIGIERDEEYMKIAESRIAAATMNVLDKDA